MSQPLQQKQIRSGDKILLELSKGERNLILNHTFADEELIRPLQLMPSSPLQTYRFTLSDLDELAGFVAAEANHAKNRKLAKELEYLYARIDGILALHTDQDN